jgi:hypothetical protein
LSVRERNLEIRPGVAALTNDVAITPSQRRGEKCALSLQQSIFICQRGGSSMTLGTILVIILILVLIGAIPNWGYSRGWGYGPSGIVGVILVVVLVLALLGRI